VDTKERIIFVRCYKLIILSQFFLVYFIFPFVIKNKKHRLINDERFGYIIQYQVRKNIFKLKICLKFNDNYTSEK